MPIQFTADEMKQFGLDPNEMNGPVQITIEANASASPDGGVTLADIKSVDAEPLRADEANESPESPEGQTPPPGAPPSGPGGMPPGMIPSATPSSAGPAGMDAGVGGGLQGILDRMKADRAAGPGGSPIPGKRAGR